MFFGPGLIPYLCASFAILAIAAFDASNGSCPAFLAFSAAALTTSLGPGFPAST
jgi:hypothetical protein